MKAIIRYEKNGKRNVPIKHECEYCGHCHSKNQIGHNTFEYECDVTNTIVMIYEHFWIGKYYGLGFPGIKKYKFGMKKKSHECSNFKER